jgi:predicted site-specific integrase-resolvase
MPLIVLSNHEIKEKIIEQCDYAVDLLDDSSDFYITQATKRIFDDIKRIAKGIVSERSVLNKLTDLIKKQEHTISIDAKEGTTYNLSPMEATTILGISRESVYRLCRQGDLDFMKYPDGCIMISEASVENYKSSK